MILCFGVKLFADNFASENTQDIYIMRHDTLVTGLRILMVGVLSGVFAVTSFAQARGEVHQERFHEYTKLLSPEKVYLHTDKDVYFATDTIWFSGYVENTSYNSEFEESNYIYVELINDQLFRSWTDWKNYADYEPSVVARVKIKRINGSFSGCLVVPEMNSTGRGIIRAYTYWMLNRPAEYMFYKEVELTNPMKDKLVERMVEKNVKDRREYMRLGEEVPFDKQPRLTEIKERYDVQFLPESGNYIAGQPAVIYVRSIGIMGGGESVYGEITDEAGNLVTGYRTDSSGFGKVMIPALPDGKLYASVRDGNGYEGMKVQLQKSLAAGATITGTMSVSSDVSYSADDMLHLQIRSSAALQERYPFVVLHNGSEIYYRKPIGKEQEVLSLRLADLTEGIHSVSVMDFMGNVYAERPFVVLPDGQEPLGVELDKDGYGKREKVSVKIKLPQQMCDSTGNFSISVTDAGIVDNWESTNIKSYMLLKSELNGYIEDLGWYFNCDVPLNERMAKADMLMQTQGWRYYDTQDIVQGKTQAPYFGREYRQTLFGKVMNPLRLSRKATVSFVAKSINFTAMGQVDSGYFVLNDIDFPEKTRFIVSAIGKNGRSTSHTPVLQDDYFAPLHLYPQRTAKVKYTPEYGKVVENIYFTKDDGQHAMAFELDPVVVSTQRITPKNSPCIIPNYPLKREWYRDSSDMKPYARNYTLGHYVQESFTQVRYNGHDALSGLKITPATRMQPGSRSGKVVIFVNGMEILDEEYYHILNSPVDNFESIVYVQGLSAAPFQKARAVKIGETPIYPDPVLMVRLKPHTRADLVPYNVSSASPIGWQRPVKFYSPRYDTPEAAASKKGDNRITLYWNPSVKLNEAGEAEVTFYTSDSESCYRIEVEGRSASGQYHYVEKMVERTLIIGNKVKK